MLVGTESCDVSHPPEELDGSVDVWSNSCAYCPEDRYVVLSGVDMSTSSAVGRLGRACVDVVCTSTEDADGGREHVDWSVKRRDLKACTSVVLHVDLYSPSNEMDYDATEVATKGGCVDDARCEWRILLDKLPGACSVVGVSAMDGKEVDCTSVMTVGHECTCPSRVHLCSVAG